MGQFTQHGYGPADEIEASWNKPLFGTVSRGKALDATFWAFLIASIVSLAIRMSLG